MIVLPGNAFPARTAGQDSPFRIDSSGVTKATEGGLMAGRWRASLCCIPRGPQTASAGQSDWTGAATCIAFSCSPADAAAAASFAARTANRLKRVVYTYWLLTTFLAVSL